MFSAFLLVCSATDIMLGGKQFKFDTFAIDSSTSLLNVIEDKFT